MPTQKAQSPQQLMARVELLQLAQLLSRSSVSGLTDMPKMCGMGDKKWSAEVLTAHSKQITLQSRFCVADRHPSEASRCRLHQRLQTQS
jgi:hypothetical protein